MTVATEPPAQNAQPTIAPYAVFATLACTVGLAFDLLGFWLFGTPFTFSIFFVLGPVVFLTQIPSERELLFDASVATLSVTLVGMMLDAIGSFVVVFPFGYQVFSVIAAATFFGMLYGWRRFAVTRWAVGKLAPFVGIPQRTPRANRYTTPNGFGPWLGAAVTICTLVAIIDLGFPAASLALCGLGLAAFALLRRWPLLVFDASLAALAALLATIIMSVAHIAFPVNALVAVITTYVIASRWRELPYADKASARITEFFDGGRSKREPPAHV